MSDRTTVSLLISTYNWPKALSLCLASIARQTVLPNEIVIADDGSGADTKAVIDTYRDIIPVPIQHVWHEDSGFRLSHIRNKAIARSNYPYIIQIDGDIILEESFIEDHLTHMKNNCFVVGSRALLNKEFSEYIIESQELPPYEKLRENSKNRLNAKRIPFLIPFFASWYKSTGKFKYYTRGCNMAFWKDSIIQVNGYNEDISGWGSEDSELVVRLLNSGKKKQYLKFGAVQFHIWHPVAPRDKKAFNDDILKDSIKAQALKANNGINKYL